MTRRALQNIAELCFLFKAFGRCLLHRFLLICNANRVVKTKVDGKSNSAIIKMKIAQSP